ncbi:unannotated protein [freshwater metagenome]|uniref:Unannotated protein n=1 Tax=freshwater metagenome TaxID=449393 RepID=A0A6J6QU14_9ZZZZ
MPSMHPSEYTIGLSSKTRSSDGSRLAGTSSFVIASSTSALFAAASASRLGWLSTDGGATVMATVVEVEEVVETLVDVAPDGDTVDGSARAVVTGAIEPTVAGRVTASVSGGASVARVGATTPALAVLRSVPTPTPADAATAVATSAIPSARLYAGRAASRTLERTGCSSRTNVSAARSTAPASSAALVAAGSGPHLASARTSRGKCHR